MTNNSNQISKVYVLDRNNNPIEGFYVFDIKELHDSDLISAPIETGQQSFDNIVYLPTIITIQGYVVTETPEGKSAMAELYAMHRDKDFRFFAVTSRNASWRNLKLKTIDDAISSSAPDWTYYTLTYKEIMLVQTNTSSPTNKEHTNSRELGRVPMVNR